MKMVYLVYGSTDYKGAGVIAVCSTEKIAQTLRQNIIVFESENEEPLCPEDINDNRAWAKWEKAYKEYRKKHPAHYCFDNYHIREFKVI